MLGALVLAAGLPNLLIAEAYRRACGLKLVDSRRPPFDTSALSDIEYENSPTGLQRLAGDLEQRFVWYDKHPNEPDSDFAALAKLVGYEYPTHGRGGEYDAAMVEVIMAMLADPELL